MAILAGSPQTVCLAAAIRNKQGEIRPLDTLAGLSPRLQQFLEDEALLTMIKLQIGKSGPVPRVPGLEARIVAPQTQQHRRDLLALAR